MVKHYIKTLDLYNLFNKYVPSSPDCLIEHAECLCVLVANIIIDNKPFYKIQKWRSKYSDSKTLELKHGHNKDFRPDCKQLVFGLNITADGHVPLSFSLHNGNTSDDVTHIPNWNRLRSLLEKEDFIYIADCKLCSNANLKTINENNGLFITIIPQGRAEIKQFKKDLQEDKLKVNWDFAYKTNHSRNKDKKPDTSRCR